MSRLQLLMTRAGIVAQGIARSLAHARVGDRMPRVQDLAAEHGVGNGTVDAALGILSDAGALRVRARGRLGTFIDELDHALLWELGGGDTVSIALPLPYSRRYEGLATALQEVFAARDLPVTLMFVRGSIQRATAVRDGRADLAIMSRFAADEQGDLVVARDFGDRTFVGAHGLVVAEGRDPADPALRVAVDPTSLDQRSLTARHFGELPPERVVEASYNQLSPLFGSGAVDATVWNVDEVEAHIASPVRVIAIPEFSQGPTTAAAAVARPDGVADAVAVADALADPTLTTIAEAVVAGDRLPSY